MIRYQQALAAMNGVQLTSWQALRAGIISTTKVMLKWLVTNPIGWAILGGTAIFGLVKAYDALTDSIEEVNERTGALLDSYNTAISEANSNAKTIESLASRYETLSKGVNNLGENVSLTADEYSEYNDIVNQIADMFPTMITGYTDEGNAILSLKGNVEQLRDAYKEAQQEAYNLLIVSGKDGDGNDIISNYQNQIYGSESFLSTTSSYIDGEAGAKDAIDIITRLTGALTPDEFRDTYNKLYEEYKNIWNSDKIQDALKSSGFEELTHAPKWSEITNEDLANVKHSAQATIQTYKAEIDSQLQNVRTLANAYLMTNEDYDKLDEQSKTAASLLVNSIDENIANGFENKVDVGAYVNKLIKSISNDSEAQTALSDLFTMDTSDMSINEIQSSVDSYISIIAKTINEDADDLKIRLGFDYSDTDPLINKVKYFLQDEFDNKVGSLTLNELDIASKLEIPEEDLLTWDELIERINEVKDSISDIGTVSLDSAKESVTGLTEEYQILQEILSDTANVSQESYEKLLACSSKYSAAIRTENGRITLNTTKLKQVAKQRQLDTKATIKETLALKKQEWLQWRNKMSIFNGELLTSIEEKYDDIGALEAEITQYELLMNTVDQCASAFERFKAAQQTEDQDMYNTAQDAFNVLKEYSSDSKSENYGKFNRDEFQEAALLLMDNETYRKALNAKDLEEYTGIVNDFVKEVTPLFDENNAKSASNLFDQINKILESGDVPEADVDWAERLGISQEMFHALEQLANQYDFNNKEIFESFQLNKLDDYTEKTQAVADAEAALATETDKTSNSYLYYSKVLQEAKKKQAQLVSETVSDTQSEYDKWSNQTGGDNFTTFGDYLKNQLDYDETDIAGVAMMIQERMQSISDTIKQMPESADTTSMQQKYQALGDILTSLGYIYEEVGEQASSLNNSESVTTSQDDRYIELLKKRKELQESLVNMDSSSADFSQVQGELEGVNSQLDILREPVTIQLNADLSNIESQLQQVQAQKQEVEKSIQSSGSSASAGDFKRLDSLAVQEQKLQGDKAEIEQKLKVVAELDSSEVDGYTPDDKELPVTATLDSSAVDGYNPPDKKMTVTVSLDTSAVDNYSPSGGGGSSSGGKTSSGGGGNFAKGTVGNAFASGYNGLPTNEKKALRSEYGQQELTVYPNGKYEITDTPTLSDLPKGTVIFNEEQTKRILKGNSHVDGTVGNAFRAGTGTKVSVPDLMDVTANNVAIKAAKASKKAADSISDDIEDTEDEFENLFDWIERRVKHFQTYFDRLLKQAETAISNSKINSYYSKATAKLEGLTDTYGKAFNRYLQQAESSGLSKNYIKKVQTGLIDLEKINNEALSKQIENYQEFFDKAQESLDSFIENAEKLYNLPLDKAKTKIEDYEEAIDSLSKRLTNAIGAANKAEIINQSVAYSAQTVTAQQEALNTTNSNLTSARKSLKNSLKTKTKRKKSGISESEWKKIENAINNGSEVNLAYFKEGSTGYQYAVKYNEALKAQVQATKELNDANEEYITTLRESKKEIFDAYASDYENNIKVIDYGIKNLDNQITLIETAGNKASKAFYDMKKSINAQELAQYEAEKKKLEELLPTIEAGTDDYYDALDAIQGCADSINQCKENQMKFNQAIEALNTQIFEEIQDQMDRIVSEQELMAELMSHYKKFDDNAIATDEGLAILGTYVSKLNVYQTKLKDTRRELEEIYKDPNFNSDAEKLKRVQELIALEQDQLKAIDDAQEDIFGWVEDYYNAQIDAMQELVDKKKEALDLEKD